jgi:hypothetical protein
MLARSSPILSRTHSESTAGPKSGAPRDLYRAVDKQGKTVDFLLRRDRGIAAAQAFFRKALATCAPCVPRKVTLDGHVPSRRALWLLRREHPCWRNVKVRTNKYLNSSSKTTARSSDDVRRWPGSSRSRARPLRSPASNSPIVFARDNSRLGVVAAAVTGRAKRNGQWHSHK